jgi:hypothetical protein
MIINHHMFDKFKIGFKNWIIELIQNLKKLGLTIFINAGLILIYIVQLYIIYRILKVSLSDFGILAFIGALFLYFGIIFLIGLIVSIHQETVNNFVNNSGSRENKVKLDSFSEIIKIVLISFLSIISGSLLIILEILIKSRQI